jgi:hypothetical protein
MAEDNAGGGYVRDTIIYAGKQPFVLQSALGLR